MAEDYINELDDSLDDVEPVERSSELYEHFRVVVDKGQTPVRIDKYLFERIVNASRNRIQAAADAGFVMQRQAGKKQLQGKAARRADRHDGPSTLRQRYYSRRYSAGHCLRG